MMAISSSLVFPVISSTWTPRARKISAALGSILSEMSTLGMSLRPRRRSTARGRSEATDDGLVGALAMWRALRARFVEGPVEPGPERDDIGGLDGCAAPDAEARRRV